LTPPADVVAVVLAAGGASRWQSTGSDHKLLAGFRGRPVVRWAVEHALAAGLSATWVVTGAVDLSAVLPGGVVVLENPEWEQGQATSLQVALRSARRAGAVAVVVGLGDQPLVPASAWRAVASAGGEVAVATYHGRRRNPVKLSAAVWDLLPVSGDEGARTLMSSRPDLVQEVPCKGDPVDIDTREDLKRWS
jgi:CTP:molybdopterin cytidylyltransferase MocA